MKFRVVIATALGLFALWFVSACGGSVAPETTVAKPHPSTSGATPKPSPEPEIGTAAVYVNPPKTLDIPAIKVHADVVGIGLNADGSMETPEYNSNLAGWYIEGPRPGAPGPAVIAAHVDNKSGPDTFARLDELDKGDKITVTDSQGEPHRFVVNHTETVAKNALPYEKVWSASEKPVLRLITCAGDYDHGAGEYRDNLIVYADAA